MLELQHTLDLLQFLLCKASGSDYFQCHDLHQYTYHRVDAWWWLASGDACISWGCSMCLSIDEVEKSGKVEKCHVKPPVLLMPFYRKLHRHEYVRYYPWSQNPLYESGEKASAIIRKPLRTTLARIFHRGGKQRNSPEIVTVRVVAHFEDDHYQCIFRLSVSCASCNILQMSACRQDCNSGPLSFRTSAGMPSTPGAQFTSSV